MIEQTTPVAELQWVDVAELHPAEDNLRQELGDLSDLSSVATLGVLEPVLLTPRAAGGYTIVAGHRRHAAAAAAGILRVPATIRAYTDDERIEVMLVENLQRRNLGPLDEARGYRRLLELGLRQQAIAGRLGISQSHVSKRLALLNLPTAAVDALHSGGITVTDAVELTKLAKHPKRLAEALRQGQEWGDVTEAVRQELDEQRAQEVREASLRTLQNQRVKVVEAPPYGSWYSRSEKPLDQLRLDPEEHAKGKCHGAAVMTDGRIVEVCRKPENHASPAAIARLERETDAQREERAKDKARRDAAKAREEHWRGLVGAAELPDGAVDFILRELLRNAGSRGCQMAARWLSLEPERDQWGSPQYSIALATYAAQGAEQLQRAAFACALGEAEEIFRSPWAGGDPQLRHLTGLLEATGYTLGQVEVDRVTPRVADDNPIDDLAREALHEGGRGLADDGEEDDVARCRVCGCTEDEPCEGGCQWVEDPGELGELCSRCAAEEGLAGDAEADQDGEGEG